MHRDGEGEIWGGRGCFMCRSADYVSVIQLLSVRTQADPSRLERRVVGGSELHRVCMCLGGGRSAWRRRYRNGT